MTGASRPVAELIRRLRREGLLAPDAEREAPEGRLRVSGVTADSREAEPGDLFLAWAGMRHDAHDFVGDAVDAGVAAAVVERPLEEVAIPQVVVTDGRRAAAAAADWWFGSPWRKLETVGVTGTNGKTTTVALTRHLLSDGAAAASMGTLGVVGPDGRVRPGSEELTTPGPVEAMRWISELASGPLDALVMEVSSHALDQHRVDGVRFDTAVFTNFSRDHLDYHAGSRGYFAAKARLVELLREEATVVVNADEPAWKELPSHPGSTVTFSASGRGDLRAEAVEPHAGGVRFVLGSGRAPRREADGGTHPVELPLVGRFNVENALAASAAARSLGRELESIARSLSTAPQIPGRMERVVERPCPVFIDFAHTPDALERVLGTLRPVVEGRLIVVFGAGGDRDRGKRPEMGRVVARGADLPIVTSDNPRTEDPEAIIDDIVPGLEGVAFERIPDRREAIARALEEAGPEDAVLLAGKGHERYQVVGATRRPFDEREIVRELLRGAADV